jgi:hypothetical protein
MAMSSVKASQVTPTRRDIPSARRKEERASAHHPDDRPSGVRPTASADPVAPHEGAPEPEGEADETATPR